MALITLPPQDSIFSIKASLFSKCSSDPVITNTRPSKELLSFVESANVISFNMLSSILLNSGLLNVSAYNYLQEYPHGDPSIQSSDLICLSWHHTNPCRHCIPLCQYSLPLFTSFLGIQKKR